MTQSRRSFLKYIGATGLLPFVLYGESLPPENEFLDVHIFSKHLQFLDFKKSAEVAAEIGFKGLDLTVRPNGHILPENVKEDLPRAVAEIRKTGLSCDMITTTVSDVENALDVDVIETAAKEGVAFYRSNWFRYQDDRKMEESLEYFKEKIRQLGEVNRTYDIVGCYQNHSGISIGASIWEVKKVLESVNPEYFGSQYDIRHAVAEGGRSWPNGIRLLQDHIKTIVLKDFKWGKVAGKWTIINVPIGEGMVDFDAYFKLLKALGLKPPASLHLEYPLGGAEKGKYEIDVDEVVVYNAMKKDLVTAQKFWMEA